MSFFLSFLYLNRSNITILAIFIQSQIHESIENTKRYLRPFHNLVSNSVKTDDSVPHDESSKYGGGHQYCENGRLYDNECGGDQANLGIYNVHENEQLQSYPLITSEYNASLNDESRRPLEKPTKAKRFKGWFSWHSIKKKNEFAAPKRETSQYVFTEEDDVENLFQEEAFAENGEESASENFELVYDTENGYALETVTEYRLRPKVSKEIIAEYPDTTPPAKNE